MLSEAIFTIPIYLRSETQYYKEKDSYEKSEIEKYGEYQFGNKVKVWWPPWWFNDIIGYLTIHKYGMSFLVYRYFTQSKRIIRDPRSRRKISIARDPEWELNEPFPQNQTEVSLKECLMNLLCKAEKDLKKRNYYINTEYYCNLISCLEIEKFLELYE
ncbi:MAG TPA: hypothetical protein VI584_05250 [Nitrospiria bacterium]|nr:hypothetical protein [Nitrospiria bacterium]